jgi:hypothetical protein
MKIYIAGPMRGYPNFNFDAFFDMEKWLQAKGYETFNPARSDKEVYGDNVNNSATGDLSDPAVQTGFSLREALGRDTEWISHHADALYMLNGWERSTGAKAEWTLGVALGLQIFYQAGIEDYEWKEVFDGTGTAAAQ